TSKKMVTTDGNTAAAKIAYALSEVAVIYPITPSSAMGEAADAWSSAGKKNIFGRPVLVQEMQSEAGAAGAIHGSLTGGALTTTFTASQGLLLMLPNMYKISGEMLPTVFHVAARSLAYQALSIYGDHSDVMAARGTGFALLSSSSVQEVQDMATIAHLSSLKSKIPFLHFFDGFRTSHEVQKIEDLSDEELKALLETNYIDEFRNRAISPEHPYMKVGAENPDVYFQGRERANKYYDKLPSIVEEVMKKFGEKTGRKYSLFEYYGAKDAENVIIAMGSATRTIQETVDYLNKKDKNAKLGLLRVHLYRPFSLKHFEEALPITVKKIAVLDRTKESGSIGEPLYLDIVAAVDHAKQNGKFSNIKIIGGRYGLSSKEFTPAMAKAVFDHLDGKCTHNFTVGINDDLTFRSLPVTEDLDPEPEGVVRCKFWGYGSDGTVSANKNAIKIIGESTDMYVQAHFAYDSKKSGGVTISHLRFGKQKIDSEYEVTTADFIALHKPSYIGRYDILEGIKPEGTFLINSPWTPEEIFSKFTRNMQETIIDKKIKVYTIDAFKLAKDLGLGNKINTIMQTAFFKLANIIPEEQAIRLTKEHIAQQFSKKGDLIIQMNYKAVDSAIANLKEVPVPKTKKDIKESAQDLKLVPDGSSGFIKDVVEPIMHLKGDTIAVSKMPLDGAVPTATAKLEKRGVANQVPEWIKEHCIQCGICSIVCPHAAIRIKQIRPDDLKNAPKNFQVLDSNLKNDEKLKFKVQVYPEDCVDCKLCVENCPTKIKSLKMVDIEKARAEGENENQQFFDKLPDIETGAIPGTLKETQLHPHYFEFSGACAGCGETPYVKLLTQMYGDRLVIANATGCSSIYGGTFPTTPYAVDKEGRGPAWANSLFEDNAEYGYGISLAIHERRANLKELIIKLLETGTTIELKDALNELLSVWDKKGKEVRLVEKKVLAALPDALSKVYGLSEPILKEIDKNKDLLTGKSVWIMGGDGWAYDIGFGGLDHVLAQNKKIKVLVLDTETYSNTGGQTSKSTPRGATAKFSTAGKETPKKNLGLMMTTYGYVYVASINMGADRLQAIKAFKEAEEYDGPAIIIAYSPCISHGIDMKDSESEGKKAADSGYWPLWRFNPSNKEPLTLDSAEPKIPFKDYLFGETRYNSLKIQNPSRAEKLFAQAEEDAKARRDVLKKMK
ncbi:MAG: pyruvate:ferredoxin (flavodoxin) oxidoreductase, partial [Candidatus Nanoarchaeia archaeon]